MQFLFETERLGLRELTEADADFAFELNADPEVVRFTGDPPFESVDAARAFLRGYDDYTKHGMGRWLVVRKLDAEPLGWCGLKRHASAEVDVGYRFRKRHWSHGYATEACRASIAYGFDVLGLERIVAHAMLVNPASIRVMEKCGMRFLRNDTCASEPSAIYEVCRGEALHPSSLHSDSKT